MIRRVALGALASLCLSLTTAAEPSHDGAHDFDFDFGTWQMHIKRLAHPLTGEATWQVLDGKTAVRKLWDGRANLATADADGSDAHVKLLALRLYNPVARQWSISFARPGIDDMGVPLVGEFKDGHGEFYDQEEYKGRMILVRFTIGPAGPYAVHSEQAFSADGGKTWEINWVNDYTRLAEAAE
jgi:hypothetical protein